MGKSLYITGSTHSVNLIVTQVGGVAVGACSRLGASLRLGAYSNKYGIDFAHFGQELGMVFEGTTFQFKMMNKEQKICESK